MLITPEQIAHLKEHEAEVADHQCDPSLTVDQWIREAEEDTPYEAYYYMCLDLGLRPIEPHPE